jgi:hypothetical protein
MKDVSDNESGGIYEKSTLAPIAVRLVVAVLLLTSHGRAVAQDAGVKDGKGLDETCREFDSEWSLIQPIPPRKDCRRTNGKDTRSKEGWLTPFDIRRGVKQLAGRIKKCAGHGASKIRFTVTLHIEPTGETRVIGIRGSGETGELPEDLRKCVLSSIDSFQFPETETTESQGSDGEEGDTDAEQGE